MDFRQPVSVLPIQVGEAAEITEGVDARRVAVSPSELQGIVSDLLDFPELQVAPRNKLDAPAVSLASGAGAVPSQDGVGQGRGDPVGPIDFEFTGAVRRADGSRLEAGIGGHETAEAKMRLPAARVQARGLERTCAFRPALPYPEPLAQPE